LNNEFFAIEIASNISRKKARRKQLFCLRFQLCFELLYIFSQAQQELKQKAALN
jgi:hypothetical protein